MDLYGLRDRGLSFQNSGDMNTKEPGSSKQGFKTRRSDVSQGVPGASVSTAGLMSASPNKGVYDLTRFVKTSTVGLAVYNPTFKETLKY